ncbi:MAG: TrkH family potassium uptake protein [Tranquillimonas sp.]
MGYVVFINGSLLIFASVLEGFDAVFFGATRGDFAAAALVTATIGACLCIATSDRRDTIERRHTFILTASLWLTAAAAGALPLILWGLDPTDALFEAMSGITTTGSTVMTGLDRTPQGILIWRAILQWIGGVGFIVTGMALLPILKVGGMQLFRTESSERGEKELGSAARFAAATIWIYLALTAACILVYEAGGMTGFDAVAHALTTVSTGGYSTYDASFGHFDSGFLQWAATGFMLSGALPFAWYIRLASRRTVQSEQVRALLTGLAAAIAALTLWRLATSDIGVEPALREVAFSVVSVVTTTGFATADYTSWGPAAVVAFFLLTATGGCTGSTAGGVKAMRWIVFAKRTRDQIRRITRPHGLFKARYEGRPLQDDVLDGVIAFFTFYTLTVLSLGLILNFLGLDLLTSVSGAVTALANVGPGIGPVIGPAGNFATLPDPAKWVLSFGMYLGRLEMLTVYVLLTRTFWADAA